MTIQYTVKKGSYCNAKHCVESARVQSYSGPHFPSFGMNTDRYLSLRIQSECGKMRTRITPNRDTFLSSDNQRIKKFYAAALVRECPDLVVTRKQNLPFADVLQNECFPNFTREHQRWIQFLIKLQNP